MPSSTLVNPKPISKEDFHKLLAASQEIKFKTKYPYWEAMLLVSLNCGYYGIDIIRLPVASVDLAKGTIVFARQKKNTTRIAVLWKRTIEALRPILAGRESREFTFETYRKGQWSKKGFLNMWDKLRKAAGLSDIEFASIRDGSLTACGHLENQCRLLAGHRVSGESDMYVLRSPSKVAKACAAIEAHYFPV
jgi:integrase